MPQRPLLAMSRRAFVAGAAAAVAAPVHRLAATAPPAGATRALAHSDVVFMYGADRATVEAYGATVLAWGDAPSSATRGMIVFGSVGMVTEFGRYHGRFPRTYEEGLCRDVHGQPVKVPWLTDMQHQGIPYWWCCTRQPVFQQYLRERVVGIVAAGADGVHVDDHLGTAGALFLGLCFCDRCVTGFSEHVAGLPGARRTTAGSGGPLDFRADARAWVDARGGNPRSVTSHPLWPEWAIYQCRGALAFMQELRHLAASTRRGAVPIGANAGLLWPRHLSTHQAVNLFSAETDHDAAGRHWTDTPLVAYRLADAVRRPYAATASGGDWAVVKAHGTTGLVRGWIALAYAAGHRLMAPHRQWCHTPELGTHWYDGPPEAYVPLYRFVRAEASRLDGFEAHADVSVVMPHASFVRDPTRWTSALDRLAAANIPYRLLLAGDALVEHALDAADLEAGHVLVLDAQDLLPPDAALVDERRARGGVYVSVDEVLAAVRPAVRVEASSRVLALPRVKPGALVVHLVNRAYDATADEATPVSNLRVTLDSRVLPGARASSCRFTRPGSPTLTLAVEDGIVHVPSLGVWGLLAFGA